MTWKEISEEYKLHAEALGLRIQQLEAQKPISPEILDRIELLSIMRYEAYELSRLTAMQN